MSAIAPPPSVPSGEPAASAAEVLRPALMLWLAEQVTVGITAQAWAFVWKSGASLDLPWLQLLGQMTFAGLVLWFVWPDQQAQRIFLWPRARVVELCLVVGVTASLLLSMWERQIPSEFFTRSPIELQHRSGWSVWACLLASAVMPAVFEELMYRGLLLQRFLRVMPLGLATAVQAMLFSAMHYDMVLLLPHFAFGLIAGVLRMAAGALWPCILMHFLWNGHIVLWQYGWL